MYLIRPIEKFVRNFKPQKNEPVKMRRAKVEINRHAARKYRGKKRPSR